MQAREELIESVCQKEVGVYQQIFSTTGLLPDHVMRHTDRQLPHLVAPPEESAPLECYTETAHGGGIAHLPYCACP